jgi:hypothetical protein
LQPQTSNLKPQNLEPQTSNLVPSHTINLNIPAEAMPPPQQPLFTDEDCNLPSQERLGLLERLQASLGNVPPHFWAACHLCDLQKLELFAQTAEFNPDIVYIAAAQAYTMIKHCKINTI